MKNEMKVLVTSLSLFVVALAGLVLADEIAAANSDNQWITADEPIMIPGEDPIVYDTYFQGNFKGYSPAVEYDPTDVSYLGINIRDKTNDYKITNITVVKIDPKKMEKGCDQPTDNGYLFYDAVYYSFNITDKAGNQFGVQSHTAFVISKTPVDQVLSANNQVYDGQQKDVDVVAKSKFKAIVGDSAKIEDYFTWKNEVQINADEYKTEIILTEKASAYFYISDGWTLDWLIEPSDDVNIDVKDLIYNSKPQEPSIEDVTVTGSDGKSVENFTLKVDAKKTSAGTYKNLTVSSNSGNYVFEKKEVSWNIVKAVITIDWISVEPNEIMYTGEPTSPADYDYTVTISDPDSDLETTGFKVEFTAIIGPEYGDTTITLTKAASKNFTFEEKDSDDGKTATFNALWKVVVPVNISELGLTVHVNEIDVYGQIDVNLLKSNVFIYPIHKQYPDFNVDNFKITVENAWGDEIITMDEVTDINDGTWTSEWNTIIVTGTNGFTGDLIGEFFVNITSSALSVGSKIVENGIQYTVTSVDKNTMSVTGYVGELSDVVIPDNIGDYRVTKVADKAFYGCKTITSLQLGDYVTSIGVKAFTNCTKLQSVEFEDSLKTISAYAFYGCTKLADVSMDDAVKTIGSYAFYKCTALKTINISGALKTLGGNAFSVSFIDADGKGITQTAKNLAGHTFEGSNKVLKLVA